MTEQHYTCSKCSQPWSRPAARGRVPKYCPTCRATLQGKALTRCAWCGDRQPVRHDGKYCGRQCASDSKRKPKAPKQPDVGYQHLKSPLRRAVEAEDWQQVIASLKADTAQTDTGCWIWQRSTDPEGYGRIRVGAKRHSPHRLMAQAAHGVTDDQPVIHHICAIRTCINPDHIIPVTQLANVAEMMQRNYYLRKIARLEAENEQLADVIRSLTATHAAA